MDIDEKRDRIIDRLFTLERTTRILLLLLIIGFVLRMIAARNVAVGADEMHFVTHAINFLSSGRLTTYDQSAGLWHALTSLSYMIFGVTHLASRFPAVLFGSFSIIVIYLLAKEFFDTRIAILAAALLTFAPFHIKYSVAEMDVMAMFFVLLSMFFFVRGCSSVGKKYIIFSGIALGLAVYTKVYPLLFIPSFFLYALFFRRRRLVTSPEQAPERMNRSFLKTISFMIPLLIVVFLFTIPALTHNYILYKEKGFLDLQFTRTLGLGKNISEQYYGWDAQFNAKNSWKGLLFGDTKHIASGKPLLLGAIESILRGDPLIFILGLLGIVFILSYRREYSHYLVFLLLSIAFILPFLASIILLPKHYLFIELLLVPPAALSIQEITNRIGRKVNKDSERYAFVFIGIVQLILLGLPLSNMASTHFYGTNHLAQLMDFKEETIPKNALVIADSRIYQGRIHWALYGRPYLDGYEFISILNKQNEIPGTSVTVDFYFIECVPDDCGWGTIKNQPQLNASMEELLKIIQSNARLVQTISEPIEEGPYYPIFSSEKKRVILQVYQGKMTVKDSVLLSARQPRVWFLYTIGYYPIEDNFDYARPKGIVEVLGNTIAHWIVILSVILALFAPIYVLILVLKR